MGHEVLPALEVAIGSLANNIRNLGLLPPAVMRAAIAAAEIQVIAANSAAPNMPRVAHTISRSAFMGAHPHS